MVLDRGWGSDHAVASPTRRVPARPRRWSAGREAEGAAGGSHAQWRGLRVPRRAADAWGIVADRGGAGAPVASRPVKTTRKAPPPTPPHCGGEGRRRESAPLSTAVVQGRTV